MIISHKHKFIFIKTRKTAGSTIEKILCPYLGETDICTGSTRDGTPALNVPKDMNGHYGYGYLINKYPKEMKNYWTFTIERNPWDKCVSAYHWHNKIKPAKTKDGFSAYLRNHSGLLPYDFPEYTDTSHKLVGDVFMYECLWKVIPALNEKLGLDIDENLIYDVKLKAGLRDKSHYSEYYNDEDRKFVAKLFKREIQEFNYEF